VVGCVCGFVVGDGVWRVGRLLFGVGGRGCCVGVGVGVCGCCGGVRVVCFYVHLGVDWLFC